MSDPWDKRMSGFHAFPVQTGLTAPADGRFEGDTRGGRVVARPPPPPESNSSNDPFWHPPTEVASDLNQDPENLGHLVRIVERSGSEKPLLALRDWHPQGLGTPVPPVRVARSVRRHHRLDPPLVPPTTGRAPTRPNGLRRFCPGPKRRDRPADRTGPPKGRWKKSGGKRNGTPLKGGVQWSWGLFGQQTPCPQKRSRCTPRWVTLGNRRKLSLPIDQLLLNSGVTY